MTITVLATLFLVMMAADDVIRSQKNALLATMDDIEHHRDEITDAKQEVKDSLKKAVEGPEGKLQKSLREDDTDSLQQFCENAKEQIPHDNLVATIFTVGIHKTILADSESEGVGYPVSDREYVTRGFEIEIPEKIFVSEDIYLAHSDDFYKYAIVAPIRDEQGEILGLLVASIAPESSKAYKRQDDLISGTFRALRQSGEPYQYPPF